MTTATRIADGGWRIVRGAGGWARGARLRALTIRYPLSAIRFFHISGSELHLCRELRE
jgi:hypothetical protein